MSDQKKISEILNIVGVVDSESPLYLSAFTHPSYLNENDDECNSYQRLEFLGDSVLSLLSSNYLFNTFKDKPEGYLTDIRAALVRTEMLAHIAQSLNFGACIRLSKGEDKNGGRSNIHILADVFEAFLGAHYINHGLEDTNNLFITLVVPYIDIIISSQSYIDAKTRLQEEVQSTIKQTPEYKFVSFDSDKALFTVQVFINGKPYATGSGKSKKSAEQEAAKKAIAKLVK